MDMDNLDMDFYPLSSLFEAQTWSLMKICFQYFSNSILLLQKRSQDLFPREGEDKLKNFKKANIWVTPLVLLLATLLL